MDLIINKIFLIKEFMSLIKQDFHQQLIQDNQIHYNYQSNQVYGYPPNYGHTTNNGYAFN